jgi:hypothetical protein
MLSLKLQSTKIGQRQSDDLVDLALFTLHLGPFMTVYDRRLSRLRRAVVPTDGDSLSLNGLSPRLCQANISVDWPPYSESGRKGGWLFLELTW